MRSPRLPGYRILAHRILIQPVLRGTDQAHLLAACYTVIYVQVIVGLPENLMYADFRRFTDSV